MLGIVFGRESTIGKILLVHQNNLAPNNFFAFFFSIIGLLPLLIFLYKVIALSRP
jgi:hypothetical protein